MPTPVAPNVVATPIGWFQADKIVAIDGAKVPQWDDQSGSAHHATQADPNKQPLYIAAAVNGLPAVRFDGVDDQLIANAIATAWKAGTGGTTFIVARCPAAVAGIIYQMLNASGVARCTWSWTAAGVQFVDTNGIISAAACDTTMLAVLSLVTRHQTPYWTYRNDVQIGDTDTGGFINTDVTQWVMGVMQADVCEVIAYNLRFTETDRANIEAWLIQKWLTQTVPDQPVITVGEPTVSVVPLTGSAYNDPSGATHASSRWQVTTADDPTFTAPIFDSGADAAHLTAIDVPTPALGDYLARVRYTSSTGGVSAWSQAKPFTIAATNHAPNQPVLNPPVARATEVDLSASAFSDPDAGDAQSAALWQVQLAGGDWSAPVFDSGWDAAHLNAITVAGLAPAVDYEARVAYRDAGLAESAFSAAVPFTTLAWEVCGSPPESAWTACPRPEPGGIPGDTIEVGIGPSDGKNTEQDYPGASATYDGVTLTWDHYVLSATSPDTFAGNPGTGQSQPFSITFDKPVRRVTVTCDNPTVQGNMIKVRDANGVELGSATFDFAQAELDVTQSIDVGENAIATLEFLPVAGDWVTWHGLSFERDTSILPCGAPPATAWESCDG